MLEPTNSSLLVQGDWTTPGSTMTTYWVPCIHLAQLDGVHNRQVMGPRRQPRTAHVTSIMDFLEVFPISRLLFAANDCFLYDGRTPRSHA